MEKVLILLILSTNLTKSFSYSQAERYSIFMAPFSTKNYNEYSPMYYNDGIVYCSNLKNNSFITYLSENEEKLINMFYVTPKDSIHWKNCRLFSKELTTNFNDGPVTFNENENIIYYSRNNQVTKKLRDRLKLENKIGIYTAERNQENWTNCKPFIYNSPDYSITMPCLSSNGKRLYFASDMPGGFGGTDLYYCEQVNGTWDKPVNLGQIINTTKNETYPFITKSGMLFFASDGHEGFGGKDIFYSKEVNGEWIVPVHLDEPINSTMDDFGLITEDNFENGYFSSNRKKTDDIYAFTIIYPIFNSCDSLKENQYCFLFYNETRPEIDTLPIRYEWDFGDGVKENGIKVEHCFPGPGKYRVKLNIIDSLTDHTFLTQTSYDIELKEFEQPYINSVDKSTVNNPISFDGLKSYIHDFEIIDYYWDFGDGYRAKGSIIKHAYEQKGEYIVKLGLSGRKDKSGNVPQACVYKKIIIYE